MVPNLKRSGAVIASTASAIPPATDIITVQRTDSTLASTLIEPIIPAFQAARSRSSADRSVGGLLGVVVVGKGENLGGSGVCSLATICILFKGAGVGADG